MVCERHDAGDPAFWVNRSEVYPWIIPKAPDVLAATFLKHGQSRVLKVREVLQSEDALYDKVYFVRRGCIGQAVVNPMVYHKTLAMNLFTPGRIMGCINLFTGTASPRRLIAVATSEVLVLSKMTLQRELDASFDLFRQMASYAELSAKSELMGWSCFLRCLPKCGCRLCLPCSFCRMKKLIFKGELRLLNRSR